MNRTIATCAVTAGLLLPIAATVAPAQAAAATCSGTYLTSMTSKNPANGNVIARTTAYRGNGQICVVTVKQNGYYGKNTYMELHVNQGGRDKADRGNFRYQAGPVTVPNRGCIHFELDLWNGPRPGSGVNIVQDFYYPGINC